MADYENSFTVWNETVFYAYFGHDPRADTYQMPPARRALLLTFFYGIIFISLAVVGTRLYTRRYVSNAFGMDDWVIIPAESAFVGIIVTVICATLRLGNAIGHRHILDSHAHHLVPSENPAHAKTPHIHSLARRQRAALHLVVSALGADMRAAGNEDLEPAAVLPEPLLRPSILSKHQVVDCIAGRDQRRAGLRLAWRPGGQSLETLLIPLPVLLAGSSELSLGILAASLPALHTLYRRRCTCTEARSWLRNRKSQTHSTENSAPWNPAFEDTNPIALIDGPATPQGASTEELDLELELAAVCIYSRT
ncbi:hypothetical protein RUND412_002620 [Rhizina undulata]